jgi:hypothetical protein
MTTPEPTPMASPKAFISYSWDDDAHREWVKQLATRLRLDGVDVTLDRWHAAPGDQVPAFMERAVRENDFVIAICTPRFQEKSDGRAGGVGYEGDIMTAYAFAGGHKKKFIPVLRRGNWQESAPGWLLGRVQVDLSGEPYSESNYEELLRTLLGAREEAPPVGTPRDFGPGTGSHPDPTRSPTPPHPWSPPPRAAVAVVALALIAGGAAAYQVWGTRPEDPIKATSKTDPDTTASKKPQTPPAAILEGDVIDGDGVPLAGATLTISKWKTLDDHSPMTTSDEAGQFRFRDLRPADEPERKVRLTATKPGYSTSTADPPLGTTGQTMRLKKLRNLTEGKP